MSNQEYKIECLSENDNLHKCVDIIDSVLGKNYIDSLKIASIIKSDKFVCLKAVVDNQIIGIAIGCVMKFAEALEYLKIKEYKIPSAVEQCDTIAIIKTIAIESSSQKKGLGSIFVKKLEKMFFNKNIHVVFTVAWRHDNTENIGPLMIKNGYKSLFIIENYYEKESLTEKFSCPVCGDCGCHCVANIYFKIL